MEGRANPKGVPVWYGALEELTAVKEMRPVGTTEITIATFAPRGEVRLVDCTFEIPPEWKPSLYEQLLTEDPELKERYVWSSIDRAFSTPVGRSDDVGSYAATQIIAELIRKEGFDGFGYRSSMNDGGFNVVVFDHHRLQDLKTPYCVVVTGVKMAVDYERTSSEEDV